MFQQLHPIDQYSWGSVALKCDGCCSPAPSFQGHPVDDLFCFYLPLVRGVVFHEGNGALRARAAARSVTASIIAHRGGGPGLILLHAYLVLGLVAVDTTASIVVVIIFVDRGIVGVIIVLVACGVVVTLVSFYIVVVFFFIFIIVIIIAFINVICICLGGGMS